MLWEGVGLARPGKLSYKRKGVKELANWTTGWRWVRDLHAQEREYDEAQNCG